MNRETELIKKTTTENIHIRIYDLCSVLKSNIKLKFQCGIFAQKRLRIRLFVTIRDRKKKKSFIKRNPRRKLLGKIHINIIYYEYDACMEIIVRFCVESLD